MPVFGAVSKVGDFSGVEPDSVPNMYDEATHGIPPKGPYLCEVIRLHAGLTGEQSKDPGSPKLVLGVSIAEPKGTKKAKYNGYAMWRHMTINEGFAGRINALLQALMANSKAFAGDTAAAKKKRAAVINAFWNDPKGIQVEGDPKEGTTRITKIGTWVVPEDGMLLGVNARSGKDRDGEPILEIGNTMPFTDAPKGQPADEEDLEDETDAEEEDTEESEEGDEEVDARAEELDGYTLAKLKTTAKGAGLSVADIKGLDKAGLIDAILDAEFPTEDEDEPEDDEEAEEEDTDEEDEEEVDEEDDGLDEMSRAELKAHIKENGLDIRVTTKKTDDDLREEIRAAQEESNDEEEDEPEPEEAPKPARRGARATAAAASRPAAKRRTGKKGEPPF